MAKKKASYKVFEINPEIETEVRAYAEARMIEAVSVKGKHERQHALDAIIEETKEKFGQTAFWKEVEGVKVLDQDAKDLYMKSVKATLENIEVDEVRRLITEDKVRPDGRFN